MGRLFGTDGARGVANAELTPELAMNIGRAAAMVLISDEVEHPTILIGKDTRLSCDMLEGALIAGLCSVGANVHILGGSSYSCGCLSCRQIQCRCRYYDFRITQPV